MTDFPDSHQFRYTVWFTEGRNSPERSTEMAFLNPKHLDDIQRLKPEATVTRIATLETR